MPVTIKFEDDRGTRATLTSTPSWIGRLFGRRPRVARIYLSAVPNGGWRFVDYGWVGFDLEQRITDELRWRTVDELPAARALKPRTP